MPKLILIVLLLLAAGPAAARMYQWVNPASGRTQMSGNPPAWYRADDAATDGKHMPRVLVFENGQLIDDTAIAVSDDRRQQLRRQAFRGAELEAHAAAAQPEASGSPKAPSATGGTDIARGDFGEPLPTATAKPTTPPDSDATINKMKALLEQWDKHKTEQAKALIEQQQTRPPAPAATPPSP